jgi:hypothetical protein
VGKPRIEEVCVRRHTYLFFEFRDHLPGEIVLRFALVVLIFAVGFLVLVKYERIGCVAVGVERVNEVLAPDGFVFSVIVEFSSIEES